ncbi:unnamed protein product, partial [Porites evermanni]
MFTYVLCGEGESFPESFGDIFARVEFGNTWAKHRNASRLFSLDDFVFENQFRAQRGWILFLSHTDDCYPKPCLNNGTCTDGVNDYNCTCVPGFVGKNCSNNTDDCYPNPCLNNGTCIDGVNDYNCTCVPGFVGKNCSN